jgi:NAD(P)-dependent dehydrogenase (short-subunit alcohol dehydrogenase family)
MPDLSNQTIYVTGAGGRLARVLIRHLQDAGGRVVGLDLQKPDVNGLAHAAAVDLADEAAVEAAFAAAAEAAGAPDALVHVAGSWDGRPLLETSLADWNGQIQPNLTTAFLCFREAARLMAQHDGGRIVGIASRQGADGAPAQQAAYAAAKAGVVRLVEACAAEFEGKGIAATAIAPSMILFGDEDAGTKGISAEEVAATCAQLCATRQAANGEVVRLYGTG